LRESALGRGSLQLLLRPVVRQRLGHTTIAGTLDRHSHVAADMQRHAADRLDAVLDAATDQGARSA
jgi:hypothetical protein